MTVQGMAPVGKHPFGLPPTGKGKTKADGNPADPGFASLLAGLIVPGALQVPAVPPVGEGGEATPPGPAGGLPILPVPAGSTPVDSLLVSSTPSPSTAPFAAVLTDLVPSPQAEGTPALEANPQDPLAVVGGVIVEAPVEEVPATGPALQADPQQPALPAVPEGEPDVAAPVDLADEAAPIDPVDIAPVGSDQPEPPVEQLAGKAFGHDMEQQNDRRNNPDLTRGLDLAAQAAGVQENRPVEAAHTERPPIAPVQTQPVDAAPAPPSGESELPASLEALRTQRHEPGRLMEAISRAVNTTQDGNYTVTLRLHPEHLGEVRLQLSLSGREVHTVMEVVHPDARQQLESRGDQLRQNLNQAGLSLSGFEVSTGQNRQSARDRRDGFEDQIRSQLGGNTRQVQSVNSSPAGAIERIRNAGRRSGRLDTMA